jgi:hypothetical protein
MLVETRAKGETGSNRSSLPLTNRRMAKLANFLKASPTLARHVARWQADDAKI